MERAGTHAKSTGETHKKRLTRRFEMQEAAREHWANMTTREDVPDDLGDFGWYYDWAYVQLTCDLAILSKFSLLPREGGMDNQDWFWLQDLKTYLQGYARAEYDAKPVDHDDEDKPVAANKRWKPFGG